MLSEKIKKELAVQADKEKAKILQGFFKTGPGQYGAGDIFIGVTMPQIRTIAKNYFKEIHLDEVLDLLHSPIHEERMTALIILTYKFEKTKELKEKTVIYKLYLKNFKYINNWDLVDLSAPKIVGAYMLEKPLERKNLLLWVKSPDLWTRRIAVLATFQFIYFGESEWTLKIAEILLPDKHDLIHKAVGWMLRELGKRVDQKIEEEFLQKYYKKMPRTMLRYAVERFSENKRKFYLKS